MRRKRTSVPAPKRRVRRSGYLAGNSSRSGTSQTGAEQDGRGENVQRLDGEVAAYVTAPRLLGHRHSIRFHTGARELEL